MSLHETEAGQPLAIRKKTKQPPQDKSGAAIPGTTGWTQIVSVVWVQPLDTTVASSTESGAKRITVTIQHNRRTVTTLTGIRTNAP